jgi:molybdopterin adenylyltransferase
MTIRIGILTVSDRAARGERADESGPALARVVAEQGWHTVRSTVIADDMDAIERTLIEWSDSGEVDVILTDGGTGFSPRDLTPEATEEVIQRHAPGIAEAMRAASLLITPHAMLSRAIAGIRSRTLIINLPGSPKGAIESLRVILPVVPHAVQLLRDEPEAEQGHRAV